MKPLLDLIDVTKRYPGVVANERVSLRVMPGEIRAVVGENGAGKSTLMKVIYGAERPDEGQIVWEGREIAFEGPRAMRALGVGMVFQHFSLFDSLTVLDNIMLSMPDGMPAPVIRTTALDTARKYGFQLALDSKVGGLSVGERQQVEIIRCLLAKPKLLIFDEPTAVLPLPAIDALFTTIRQLATEGCAILYISHKLAEIKALCDSATVLRSGKRVAEVVVKDTAEEDLAELMTGRELPVYERTTARIGGVAFEVRQLSSSARTPEEVALHGVCFSVGAGEIVGIAGVSGSGQRELFELLSGERVSTSPDTVVLQDTSVGLLGVKRRRGMGLAYIPEERVGHGSLPDMALDMNHLLSQAGAIGDRSSAWGLIRLKHLAQQAAAVIRRFNVKATGPAVTAGTLSGGNLQKFIVGRELAKAPSVLLVSQPTWGVDIASSLFIRQQITQLAASGAAVVVGSEDVDELMQICNRIMVIAKGRVSPAVPADQMNPKRLGLWMAGLFVENVLPETETV